MENTSTKTINNSPSIFDRFSLRAAFERYFIKALNGMAFGLFATLIVGLILKQIGTYLHFGFSPILLKASTIATVLTGAGIGVGISETLKAPRLVMVTTAISGFLGAQSPILLSDEIPKAITLTGPGDPLSALVCAVVCCEIGILISNKTRVDILVTPLVTLTVGAICAYLVSPPINQVMSGINSFIVSSTQLQPVLMSIVISATMGMILTLPISSAAISIILGLSGIAAGASTIGCCTQMIGFAVISYKANGVNGLIAQGIGTSMIQVPNIMRKPIIWLPPTLASAILGPIATVGFGMVNNPYGAGMGTSGLVGQIMTWETMSKTMAHGDLLIRIGLLHFILPAILTYIIYKVMEKYGIVSYKDYDLKNNQ